MNYNRYKQKAILSMIAGVASAILSGIVFTFTFPNLAFSLAIITGLMTVVLAFPLLVLKELIDNRRYKEIEEEMGKSIIHSIRAHIETQSGIISSKVYFTEEMIIFACAKGRKLMRESLRLNEIFTVVTDGFFSLNIYTKDKQIFKINSAEVPEILPFVKKHSANMNNK